MHVIRGMLSITFASLKFFLFFSHDILNMKENKSIQIFDFKSVRIFLIGKNLVKTQHCAVTNTSSKIPTKPTSNVVGAPGTPITSSPPSISKPTKPISTAPSLPK